MESVYKESIFGENLLDDEIPEFFRLMNFAMTHWGTNIRSIRKMPGGLTNKNFVVTMEDGHIAAVRVAGKGTSEYIDRTAEKINLSSVGAMGIAPEIYYFNTASGGLISEFIPYPTMHPEDFIHRSEVLQAAARSLFAVHNSKARFKGRFDPIEAIRGYLQILEQNNFKEKYEGFYDALKKLNEIEKVYQNHPPILVPCHNDVLAENFLFDDTTMRVIDWEYSGMNDAYYDVACVIVENPLDETKEAEFLRYYINGEPDDVQLAKVLINKFLVTFHWSLWSLVQICAGKDYDFYWEYGRYRSEFFNRYLADPAFAPAIELLNK